MKLSAQSTLYTKMVLSMDGTIYFVEDDLSIFKLKNNVKTLTAFSSAKWNERFEDKKFHLNYIIVKDKLISLFIGKGNGPLVRNKIDYSLCFWKFTFECVDLSMLSSRKSDGIPFFPSPQTLNIDSCDCDDIYNSHKPIYYDFIEYNDSVFLFLKTTDHFYIFKSLMPFRDAYHFAFKYPGRKMNKWEMCSKFPLPDKLEFFVSYVDTDNNLIISFDNNVNYRIDDELSRMQEIKKSKAKYNKNVLLQANGKYYWVSDSVANALKESNDPVAYFKSNIKKH